MKIPARYIGLHTVQLRAVDGPHLDGEGKPLESLILRPGDSLMMNDTEVLGQTFLVDPHSVAPTRWLGVGRVILPEHSGLSPEQLTAVGYEFHEGRADFEPIVPAAASPSPSLRRVRAPQVSADVPPAPQEDANQTS